MCVMTSTIDELLVDCWVITLARLPDKLVEFRNRNQSVNLPFHVFLGVDGQSLNLPDLVKKGLATEGLSWKPGAVGNALSHCAAWERCCQQGRPMLVLEDDALVSPALKSDLPRLMHGDDNWDIVLLGYNTDSCLDVRLSSSLHLQGQFTPPYPTAELIQKAFQEMGPTQLFRLNNAFGIVGYLVSPRGAAKLIEGCFPISDRVVTVPALKRHISSTTLDGLMNGLYRDLQAYACVPPLVLSPNDRATSTVV